VSEKRVKDFTYYPLMSDGDCTFRVENHGSVNTFHRCPRYAKRKIEGYGFCEKHAAFVEREVKGTKHEQVNPLG
jgi:hypothetical protein